MGSPEHTVEARRQALLAAIPDLMFRLRRDGTYLAGERLDEPVERAVYYFVAEALANASKHAHAATVSVRVAAGDGSVVAEVADDGRGGASAAPGGGLAGLRDRIVRVGGELTIERAPDAGTRLRAVIPLGAR